MEPQLPPLPAWQARSFWLAVVMAAAQVSVIFNFDIFGYFGVTDAEHATDVIMQVITLIAGIWMWFERKNPKRSLSLSGENAMPHTLRSPVIVGAAALLALAVSGCDRTREAATRIGISQDAQDLCGQLLLASLPGRGEQADLGQIQAELGENLIGCLIEVARGAATPEVTPVEVPASLAGELISADERVVAQVDDVVKVSDETAEALATDPVE